MDLINGSIVGSIGAAINGSNSGSTNKIRNEKKIIFFFFYSFKKLYFNLFSFISFDNLLLCKLNFISTHNRGEIDIWWYQSIALARTVPSFVEDCRLFVEKMYLKKVTRKEKKTE